MGWIPERDDNGFALFKPQIADKGLSYEPRSFDFFVGKYKSLYNRKFSGNGTIEGAEDFGDGFLKFYDSDMIELTKEELETDSEFQTRLDNNCYCTKVEWVPSYERKPIGAIIQVLNAPNYNAYLWTYVDLSAVVPGYKIPYLEGGWNLRFFQEKHPFFIDSRTCSDEFLPAFIPIVFMIRHGLINDSNRFGIQIMLEHYK